MVDVEAVVVVEEGVIGTTKIMIGKVIIIITTIEEETETTTTVETEMIKEPKISISETEKIETTEDNKSQITLKK